MQPERIAARFWAKVNKSGPVLNADLGPCWVWTGFRAKVGRPKGYGQLTVGGAPVGAHRVAFFVEHGRWPSPCTLHLCDGGAHGCVRAAHLREGTHRDNTRDMMSKGRSGWVTKLTADAVLCIRKEKARGVRIAELAERFRVSKAAIRKIANRKTWAHLEDT